MTPKQMWEALSDADRADYEFALDADVLLAMKGDELKIIRPPEDKDSKKNVFEKALKDIAHFEAAIKRHLRRMQ